MDKNIMNEAQGETAEDGFATDNVNRESTLQSVSTVTQITMEAQGDGLGEHGPATDNVELTTLKNVAIVTPVQSDEESEFDDNLLACEVTICESDDVKENSTGSDSHSQPTAPATVVKKEYDSKQEPAPGCSTTSTAWSHDEFWRQITSQGAHHSFFKDMTAVLMKKIATQRNCLTVFIAYKDLGWLCQDSDENSIQTELYCATDETVSASTNPQYLAVLMKKIATQRNCLTVFIAYKDLGWLCQDSDENSIQTELYCATDETVSASTNPQYLAVLMKKIATQRNCLTVFIAYKDLGWLCQDSDENSIQTELYCATDETVSASTNPQYLVDIFNLYHGYVAGYRWP